MDAIDFFWHLANLFAVSLLLGAVAAAGAKLLWRRALAMVSLLRLAGTVAAAAALVTLGGLVVFGRDGRMATYGLMVLATAAVLAWFTRGRA
jgi:hypothetical protein